MRGTLKLGGKWRFERRDHPRICGEHLYAQFHTSSPAGSSPHMRGTPSVSSSPATRPGIIPAYAGNTTQVSVSPTSQRDHPRICGEHLQMTNVLSDEAGSSPHMRGTRDLMDISSIVTGIIPAYAGNTSSMRYRPVAYWDHPRICGEHYRLPTHVEALRGSSPHMRGTQKIRVRAPLLSGIIPAYAGNTHTVLSPFRRIWDHPRICGEHYRLVYGRNGCVGSSPHMRGTQLCWFAHAPMAGIIPAYAGNTSGVFSELFHDGDHPRICGEHSVHEIGYWSLRGSSPHMRGTPMACFTFRAQSGIIPAYAGNTSPSIRPAATRRDHPRICGEHGRPCHSHGPPLGSSPHMRGTPLRGRQGTQGRGIIPAYAGNTVLMISVVDEREDHPRICGEHCLVLFPDLYLKGSSPHMRGTHRRRSGQRHCKGIIPAYAGNTKRGLSAPSHAEDHPRICGEHDTVTQVHLLSQGSSPHMRGTRR